MWQVYTNLNITRLECKEIFKNLYRRKDIHLNITRLECKGCWHEIQGQKNKFEYNQVGM